MTNNVECDTNILKEASHKVLTDCADFETKINHFFTRLCNMPSSGEWTGKNAEEYCNRIIQDKEIYLKYIEGIKEIAKKLNEFSDGMDSTIRKNETECEW